MGVSWIPSENVRNEELVGGVLKHSIEGTFLEVNSHWLHSAFALESTIKGEWRRRVVGKLGDGVSLSMEECYHTGTSMRRESRMKFEVSGNDYSDGITESWRIREEFFIAPEYRVTQLTRE